MSFSFALSYKPDYQRRYGMCKICRHGIETGIQIMVGTGFFNGHMIVTHNHFECWAEEVMKRANDWFFANEFRANKMNPEQKAELNRLRAKRYYYLHKGGDANEIVEMVRDLEKQIALVKGG